MSENSKITLFFNRVNPFKTRVLSVILTGGLILVPSFFDSEGMVSFTGNDLSKSPQEETADRLQIFQENTLMPTINPVPPETLLSVVPSSPEVVWQFKTIVTGYSSTPDQTDDTPFITASGKLVREGIVAANFVPLGTRIRLPELYGDKIFIVEDRMHPRKYYLVDIWFPTREEALNFGAKTVTVEVLPD